MTQAALLPFKPAPCPDTLEARFWAFHAANPAVYDALRLRRWTRNGQAFGSSG